MPSFRIPPPLRFAFASSSATPRPQPPITVKDPRLQAFLQVSFGVLYDWNIENGAIAFSEQLDELLGLPAGAFPRHIEGWLESIHPDDHDATMAALADAVLEGGAFLCDYRLQHADGSWLTVSDQGVLLSNRSGRATNMIGALRDVTRERAAQAVQREADELRRVLFRLPSPAMQVDAAGAYVDADAHALEFFERSRDQMLASSVTDDFAPDVAATITSSDDAAGGAEAELEVECTVNGRPKHLLLSIIPTRFDGERGAFLLGTDISEQKLMQQALGRSERTLRRQATILDERNTALRVLLEQREQERRELEDRIVRNVDDLIAPTLDRLSHALRHRPERLEVDALKANLREIVSPFGRMLALAGEGRQPLTRREKEVANLVRQGRTSDEIAQALYVSRAAVAFHRANIRRKLGIPKRGPHLATHLASLGEDTPL